VLFRDLRRLFPERGSRPLWQVRDRPPALCGGCSLLDVSPRRVSLLCGGHHGSFSCTRSNANLMPERHSSIEKIAFIKLIRAIIRGETRVVSRMIAAEPALATAQAEGGATRQDASEWFFEEIGHYLYAGDTALHMAAAAFQRQVAELLVRHGAHCRARNRRGAEPLHYAADANHWQPAAQKRLIEYLLAAGADPNALDKSGVSPLHRAVRTRAAAAVHALLSGGARVDLRNASGSTPLHLAVQNTGRGGSGSARALREQEKIIAILLDAGARAVDEDGNGRSVRDAASNDRIRALLETRS
jgi:Ankyrin repeats (3 copies)/Ankyrin repeat